MNVYYFGCRDNDGHFLYDGDFRMRGSHTPRNFPLKKSNVIDGLFVGADDRQSECALVTVRSVGVWTILQCADYTGDSRPGSNSALIAEGDHDFAAMKTLFAVHFPTQLARIEKAASLSMRGPT